MVESLNSFEFYYAIVSNYSSASFKLISKPAILDVILKIKPGLYLSNGLQRFSFQQTTLGTFHPTSLLGFGYGDVVHQERKAL